MTWKDTKEFIQDKVYHTGKTSLVILEEDYKMMYDGYVFKNFSPYFETFNEMLGWMESFGFMAFWRRNFIYSLHSRSEEIGPQVLTMDHLRVGFFVCLVPLGFSVFAFIIELIVSRFLKLILNLRFVCIKKQNSKK